MIHLSIIRKLEEAKQDQEKLVSQGLVTSFEAYRFHTGKIQGYKDSIEIIEQLVNGSDA